MVSMVASRRCLLSAIDHDQLADLLKKTAKSSGGPSHGGLDNNEWAAVVIARASCASFLQREYGRRSMARQSRNCSGNPTPSV